MLDSLGMLEAALGLPEQLARAASQCSSIDGLPSRQGLESVLVVGMGGSGIAGDAAAAVAGSTCPLPIVVSKHYECPGFVGPGSLVIAISFSGNTEETVSVASAAAAAGARLVVIAAGGELERLASSWSAPVLAVDASIPMPRAAIGSMTVPVLAVLEQLGLFDGATAQIDAAVEQARRRRDELGGGSRTIAALARRIGRTLPIVYGGGAIGEVAALRWKNQFNENPKVAAFANTVPELTHNEICGWAQHGDVTRQVFSLLLLRHAFEHPQTVRRFELVEEICDEVVAGVHSVTAQGDGPLAQLFDLVLLGDVLTLQLAANEGVDPGPIPVLEELKARVAGD